MTERKGMPREHKKTPSDASEFEREQLRFLLSEDNIASALSTVNPSLAWLPVLREMQLIEGEHQLFAWIERNLAEVNAVRDVVANIHFFGPDTANFLEFRVNSHAANLPPLLVKCWRLIIRHMKAAKSGFVQNEWYEIAPRVSRGEHSAELLERIAEAVRPKLKLSKRSALYDSVREPPDRPSDLMSIDYEVEDNLSADEVLQTWPEGASAETDSKLLSQLAFVLESALADATEVGVEANEGYSTSDSDVPSVAQHGQNAHRSGFQVIVRVIAEIWARLAEKSSELARDFARRWRGSEFRLTRRLALFASANPIVPPDFAADALIELPAGELFLTNSSVEVYRLILTRWKEFSEQKQHAIMRRLREGPPRGWFREDAEVDRAIDRCRFDLLAEMERSNLFIGEEAVTLLNEIRAHWPEWRLRPLEQAGFSIWHGSVQGIVGDSGKLNSIPDDQLAIEAKRIAAAADFMDGDSWHALCLSDPDRALRGLRYAVTENDWAVDLWQQLLWTRKEYAHAETAAQIAQLLMQWPEETLSEIAPAASSWLEEHAKVLEDTSLWPLWDRIADILLDETDEVRDGDVFTEALNSLPGRLAEIVIKKLTRGGDAGEHMDEMCGRLDKLVDAPGRQGKLARVRLAAEVSYLFERVPEWTRSKIIPHFEWTSIDAVDVWEARKYSNYIGSPELFALTKAPFLEMFGRTDVTAEDLRTFAEWLTTILVANQSLQSDKYPLTGAESRAALRRAGVNALPSVGHRLAIEMEAAEPDQKIVRWRTIVGPVFQAIWPLDVELQSHTSTFKLVQILKATGDAFSEAADVIVPFVRPEDSRSHTTIYSIANAPDALFQSSPRKMLDLVAAVIGEALPGSVFELGKALSRICAVDPDLANTRKFQKLRSFASP